MDTDTNTLAGTGGSGPEVDAAMAVVDERGIVVSWNGAAQRLLGYAAEEVTGRPAANLLAADLPEPARRCLDERRSWNGLVRLRHRDGSHVNVELLAHPSRDDGSLRWLLVTLTAPPPARLDANTGENVSLMDRAFTQSSFALAINAMDLRCLRVNERMCRMCGVTEDELRGRRVTEVLPGPQWDALELYMRYVLQTGEPVQRVTYRRVPSETRERAWSVSISPLKDETGRTLALWTGVLDITEQYWARQRLTLLNEAGARIGTTLDVTRTAEELVDTFVPRLADFALVDLLGAMLSGDEPILGPLTGTIALRRVAHQSIHEGVPEAVVAPEEVDFHPADSPMARCLASGTAVLTTIDDPAFMASLSFNPARAASARAHGIHSVLAVPIRARGVTLGVAVLARGRRPDLFQQDDVLLAEELTARAAVCLDNARRYTRERATALALQRSLLPQRLPEQSAVEVATHYLPASTHAGVGGDWFDVIPLSGARVALVVGDVVGHGLHASATMGRLRTAVRTLADVDLPPDELLTRLDDLVARLAADAAADGDDDEGDIGATCLYAVYDPVSRRCSLARAGHPLPVLVTPDGDVDFLDLPAGPPLGLGGLPFEGTEVELPEGSTLALYTDGLVESRHHDIDVGLERLRRALSHPDPSLEATCDTVLEAVLPERPMDDVALLVARTRALGSDRVATWGVPADPAHVADARKLATKQLTDWGLDDAAFVTELIVSELVTNAIRYAEGPIQLRLIRDRTLICEVSDASDTAPHLRRARAFDEGGRGLLLVAQLTQRWGTRQTPHGKTIWAEVAPALG
ncbi:SpoIIE family protein phosphatase [Actinomadura rudentiformis]|uniref:SpoIIE family protein phosphatase n=1 Tax=Actinomadura rudentiformis TaxID=359158 RepID=A0A6H9YRV6_9ACTN|nr:SpoIIE family protein phosphatase [Actinomadura rudentiformis]KAB2350872.1 SpoIIE family protein phosphatase [Actinomadura rudentiformis]